ncbi:MAG: low molecular weight phosphatase family protein [Bryobacteraceae bacterium]
MTLFEKVKARRISVLFVCVGNACRSQMAEAFANAYGRDVMDASSAGLAPAARVSRTMRQVMAEKKIVIGARQPRRLNAVDRIGFDLVVNFSGYALPRTTAEVLEISVADPGGKEESFHRRIRDQVEQHVESLIARFREARGLEASLWETRLPA